MRPKLIVRVLWISIAGLVAASCGSGGSSTGDKAIKSTTSGDITITLANESGQLKSGESKLMLVFSDQSGKPVDVGAASLKFHMPAMGGMSDMSDSATLTTTDTPGRYSARVNIETAGTWEAIVNYQGPKGTGQVSMTVNAH